MRAVVTVSSGHGCRDEDLRDRGVEAADGHAGAGLRRVLRRRVLARVTQARGAEPDWIANCLDGWAWVLDSLEHSLETGRGLPYEAWARDHVTYTLARTRREES